MISHVSIFLSSDVSHKSNERNQQYLWSEFVKSCTVLREVAFLKHACPVGRWDIKKFWIRDLFQNARLVLH